MGLILSILILGFIIFVHELGHFFMAKIFKVPVSEFSIGMGPRLFSKIFNNTRYSIKVFPFGGSCAMIGEDAAGSGDFTLLDGKKIDNSLYDFNGVIYEEEYLLKYNYSVIEPIKKFFICIAGPFMNLLIALIFATFVVSQVGFDEPIINQISPNSAAAEAKPYELLPNDKIIGLEIPGEYEKVIAYRDLLIFMQLNNDLFIKNNYPLAIKFERNKKIFYTILYPKFDSESGKSIIGITFNSNLNKPNNFIDTINMAFKELYFCVKTTIMSLKLLISGKLGSADISGPVGTVAVMGDAIQVASNSGFLSIMYTISTLIVLISSNLGVMNLLPIPALDGGRLVFATFEMVTGKSIDKKIEAYINSITTMFLLLFMIYVFGMDIYKLLTGSLY